MTDTVVEIPIPSASLVTPSGGDGVASDMPFLGCFLVGPENALVRVVIDSLLEGDDPHYYPVTLVGPSGCGKSHLAWGLAAVWRQRSGPRSAVYVPAVDFARELTDAFEAQATEEFQNRYRRVDLLAIDDLEHLVGRPAAQEELLHTLDALEGVGRVLLTTDSSQRLTALLPRLRSRLAAGLTVPLVLPSRATRLAAARSFAESRGLTLPVDAAEALADRLEGSLPQLWGTLLHLNLLAQVEQKPITAAAVQEAIAQCLGDRAPSLRRIAAATARRFSLRVAEIRSSSQRRAVVLARDVAMYLARSLTARSYGQIGVYFNGRDHTTVAHGCSKTEELLKRDAGLRHTVEQLRDELRSSVACFQ